eukprot:3208256-Pleurochrysis_carterae.AAC.1
MSLGRRRTAAQDRHAVALCGSVRVCERLCVRVCERLCVRVCAHRERFLLSIWQATSQSDSFIGRMPLI